MPPEIIHRKQQANKEVNPTLNIKFQQLLQAIDRRQ